MKKQITETSIRNGREATINNLPVIIGKNKISQSYYLNNLYFKKDKMKTFKVVLAGASGSGKTTLAKAIAEHFGWLFRENSAGLIIMDDDKDLLKHLYKYNGNWGQQKVINESHKTPDFGLRFQNYVLNGRYALMHKYENNDCIFDRSFLDPMVFMMNQVAHNITQDDTENFMLKCTRGMKDIDLVLRIPLQNPEMEIEHNGSRVDNWFFQYKIDYLFDAAINLVTKLNDKHPFLLGGKKIRISKCPCWDWDMRLDWAIQMVKKMIAEN